MRLCINLYLYKFQFIAFKFKPWKKKSKKSPLLLQERQSHLIMLLIICKDNTINFFFLLFCPMAGLHDVLFLMSCAIEILT